MRGAFAMGRVGINHTLLKRAPALPVELTARGSRRHEAARRMLAAISPGVGLGGRSSPSSSEVVRRGLYVVDEKVEDVAVLPVAPVVPSAEVLMFSNEAGDLVLLRPSGRPHRAEPPRAVSAVDLLSRDGEVGQVFVLAVGRPPSCVTISWGALRRSPSLDAARRRAERDTTSLANNVARVRRGERGVVLPRCSTSSSLRTENAVFRDPNWEGRSSREFGRSRHAAVADTRATRAAEPGSARTRRCAS